MKDLNTEKKIAVLIDADNASRQKLGPILDELNKHGHLVVKKAYGDWSKDNLKNWPTALNEHAIDSVQQFAYTTGKNATDSKMIIDAMDLLYTGKFDAFAIVSSDSDFTALATRLRTSEIFVFGFGESKTPTAFRNACDDFVFTENLGEEPKHITTDQKDRKAVERLLIKAWQDKSGDDGWLDLGQAGSLLKRQRPDFDHRSFGAKTFAEFVKSFSPSIEVERISRVKGKAPVTAMRVS
ncbi:NYN domain-containing protein [Ferrimonas balearica]|uniref:NYN domain-containing protein n=1 Tax=Ferrimonas balearica TaxID=44012 RepID=UPI001C949170|nr:NYN domain-containing protein [Ferrimonas balearica]MBY6222881.1 NYN domain-containing protein [Ferrimonas balearica]